ncbi:MAG: serine/threonine-protein kinase, partial [Polyangiaceae bacterium]
MNPSKAFGPYEILDRISVGGMAEVFRARSRANGTIVALKRMLPQVAEDGDAIAMFEDEARICMRLENTHIARMLDYGRVDDSFFIAFEYVFGRDLRYVFDRAVRTKEEIPLKALLYIFTRVGEGLAYAHARKDDRGEPISIVHRDVSPQNVVVSFDGDVKLIDFGIAKAAGRLSMTQVGSIKGKFGYMSPEQVSGEPVDARTDVFSLGICMWELLTLQRLFSGANELIVLEKIKNLAILPPSAVVGRRLPPELDRIILKALAKDPAERYRAAKDLYRELNHFSETHDFVANRGEIAQYMRRTFPEASGRDVAPRSGSSLPPRTLRDAAPETQRDVFRPGWGGVVEAEPESDRTVVRRNDEERMNMAAEKQGGSDLDIFEGLGKKASQTKTPQTSAPPPPPSSLRAPPPVPSQPPQVVRGDMTVGKKTLLGVQSPLGGSAGGSSSSSVAPPSQRSIPAARGSLPDISAPPKKNTLAQSGAQPVAVPSAAETKPAGFADQPKAVASVEMDWDEDEEATHVLDRDDVKPPSGEGPAFAKTSLASTQQSISRQAPPPSSASMMNRGVPQLTPQPRPSQPPPLPKSSAASMRPATSVSAPPPPPAPPSANFRSGPPAPPGSVSRPPPPPSMSQPPQQFGQMGQAAGSYPPPSAQNPFQQPIQTHTAPMAMPGSQ